MNKWILITFFAALSVVPRLFYLDVPFSRDEGVYAYISDVIDQGGLPYRDAFDHKPPGVHYLYNLSFHLLGRTIDSPRIVATSFVMAACLFSFAIVYRITSNFFAGILTMAFLGLASSSPGYAGYNTNTEIFALPFLIGGTLFLLDEEPSWSRYFLSGLLFGIGFVIKQPVMVVAFAVFAYSVMRLIKTPWRFSVTSMVFALGFSIPFLLFLLYFVYKGSFNDFWTGYFTYNFSYVAGPGLKTSFAWFKKSLTKIFNFDAVTWYMGLTGIFLFLISSSKKHYKLFFLSGLIGAAISVSMGKYFYLHYFIFFIPFLTIGAGLGIAQLSNGRKKAVVMALSAVVLMVSVGKNLKYFKMSDKEVLRVSCFEEMPFYQSVALGEYLRKHPGPNGTAYIIGSEPQIHFYSGLKSPVRFSFFYPLMLRSELMSSFRAETLAGLRNNMPDYVIAVNDYSSNFINKIDNDPFLMELFREFSRYKIVAISNSIYNDVLTNFDTLQMEQLVDHPWSMLVFKQAEDAEDSLAFGSIYGP